MTVNTNSTTTAQFQSEISLMGSYYIWEKAKTIFSFSNLQCLKERFTFAFFAVALKVAAVVLLVELADSKYRRGSTSECV